MNGCITISKIARAALLLVAGIGLFIISATILNTNYPWVFAGYTGNILKPDASTYLIIAILMIMSLVLICVGCTSFPKKNAVDEEGEILHPQSQQQKLSKLLICVGALVEIVAGFLFIQFLLIPPSNPGLTFGGVPIETLVSAFSIIIPTLVIIGIPLLYVGVRLDRQNSTKIPLGDLAETNEDQPTAQALPSGTKKCPNCGAIIPEAELYC